MASFIILSRLSRSKTFVLLKFLKSVKDITSLQGLPSDYRTLLYTPLSGKVYINQIAGEDYTKIDSLELWFDIDGLPIDKRGQSFWQILCGVSIQQCVKSFITGAYFGSKKPSYVFEYLNLFIEKLNDLSQNGITI